MTDQQADAICELFPRAEAALPPQRIGWWSMPFRRGPLHGQTLDVYGWLGSDPTRPSVPPLVWHFEPDGHCFAYKLVEDDPLNPTGCCPVYVLDAAFPPPAPADAPAN